VTAAEPTTEQLVAAAQGGDAVAREALFARYAPRVARMVAAHLGVPRATLPARAEDMAQDALASALSALERFEVRSRGAFAAWMATIVVNCVRRHQRDASTGGARAFWQRYGDLELRDSIFAGREPNPSGVAQRNEDNDRVEQCLLALPALYRTALSLRYLGQLSHAEIAQQLGRTEANCRKIVQRALEMLQAALAQRP
jgi:RNA polymerase sigma-70 factor (ECF subfamily)